MAWGGWLRRWISDDGLIVLRTVRNLMAGNGPVFNAGERVEANTSTIWQYLIWAAAELTGARLETVSLFLALGLSVLAVGGAALTTGLLASHKPGRDALVMVPVGLVAYVALPPARDFATSGLEWGLCLFWVAGLWLGLVCWVCADTPRGRGLVLGGLAFWAGLSWLVRPELALYGGLTGIYLLVAHRSWRATAIIIGCGLPVPAAYQLFRMGYYGLLVPHTAVAKAASGSDWGNGWAYLRDFVGAYQLWFPALLLGIIAVILAVCAFRPRARTPRSEQASRPQCGGAHLRTPVGITALILVCGFLYFLYVLRVGGDFMHGRMWLIILFTLLLPVSVVPVADLRAAARGGGRLRPDATDREASPARHEKRRVASGGGSEKFARAAVPVAAVLVVSWAGCVTAVGHRWDLVEVAAAPTGIVDERAFWTDKLNLEAGRSPLYATDYLGMPTMRTFPAALHKAQRDNDAQIVQLMVDPEIPEYDWVTVPRSTGTDGTPENLREAPMTLYLINLGMTSMNSPLDVRVLDTFGLATPLAGRQPRDEDARVGHNKALPFEWQLADGASDLYRLPVGADPWRTAQARRALGTAELQELFASYREPLTFARFVRNIGYAVTGGRTLQLNPDPGAYAQAGQSDVQQQHGDAQSEHASPGMPQGPVAPHP